MLLVSGETKTESLITEPINFILSNKVKDGTDDTLPDIRYKDAIDAIQHSNEIIDNNIFIVKNSYFLEVRMVSLSELKSRPVLSSSTKSRIFSQSVSTRFKLLTL